MSIGAVIKRIPRILFDRDYRFRNLAYRGFYRNMSDEEYIRKMFKATMGYELDLENPKTFNEKLQWLKLYDRKPEYTMMVDKYLVRSYVKEKIGEQYLIPLIGVWDTPEQIDFGVLPSKFVLKCNHNSGVGMCICQDKSSLDIEKVKKELWKGLKEDYYTLGREWPYKDVPRKIICEQYMEDNSTKELRDYKLFTFDGVTKALFIATDRQNPNEDTKFDFFDANFVHLPFTNGHSNAEAIPRKPQNFEKMKELAAKLAEGIPEVRVDFYEVNGDIYFGELTFSHWSGFVPFKPTDWDEKFGEWIELPKSYGGGIA